MTESTTRKSLDNLPVAGEASGRVDGDGASTTTRTRGSEEKHELERGVSEVGFVNEVGVTLIYLQERSDDRHEVIRAWMVCVREHSAMAHEPWPSSYT